VGRKIPLLIIPKIQIPNVKWQNSSWLMAHGSLLETKRLGDYEIKKTENKKVKK
jgi:hypothetical protein